MEFIQSVQLLTDTDKLDRLAGDRLDGKGRASAGVAVELGQDHSGKLKGLGERLRRTNRILTRHRIADEKGFIRLRFVGDLLQLAHQLVIDVKATGGVEDDDVTLLFAGGSEGRFTNLWRSQAFLMENRHVQLATEHLQLLDGRGPLQVCSDEHRPLLFSFAEVTGQLAAGGRLSRTLQTRHQDHRRARFLPRDLMIDGTHQIGEFILNDLGEHLAGVDTFDDFRTEGGLTNALFKILDHRQRGIRLQQRPANLAARILDDIFGDLASTQASDDGGQSLGQSTQHRLPLYRF